MCQGPLNREHVKQAARNSGEVSLEQKESLKISPKKNLETTDGSSL